ncbi:PAS domain S-box protein [Planctomycetota bacterium]
MSEEPNVGDRTSEAEVERLRQANARLEDRVRQESARADLGASLLNARPDTVALIDGQGTVLSMNAAGAQRFGMTPEEMAGQNIYRLIPEPLSTTRKTLINDVIASGEASHFEDERAGVTFANSVYAFDNPVSGERMGAAVFATDVTKRHRAKVALRESEERYRSFVEHFPGIAFRSGLDWTPIFFHGAVEAITGYSEKDFLAGSPRWDQIMHPDDLAAIMEAYPPDTFRKGTTIAEREYRICRRNGELRWVRDSLHTVSDASGDLFLDGTVYDITDRKEAERSLAEHTKALERSNRELEQFAYVASHDLQEPLRMVSSYTQLLARRYEGQIDDDGREFVRFAVDGANRMQRLINDLLEYSRVTTRGRTLSPTDSHSALGEVIRNLSTTIDEGRALVSNDDLPVVEADRSQLVRLLQNLIANAIKFRGDDPPRIHVSAERHGASWVFAIRDNGIGIEACYHDRIFTIFQRLHSRTEYEGTGMGLALCKRIVERHDGRIWVESQEGRGSTFCFTMNALPEREAP